MRTIGLIHAAAHAPRHDLTPRLRARLAESRGDEPVRLELPAFSWPWRLAAGAAAALPFAVPDPVRFLAASGLLWGVMRRRDLLAYVIGAAVAGTALAFPYALRELLRAVVPTLPPIDAPFFLLPIAWGAWNVVWVRCRPRLGAPGFGAILGVMIAGAGNALMAVRGTWGAYMLLLFLWGPAIYAFGWAFLVVPLNRALEVEP